MMEVVVCLVEHWVVVVAMQEGAVLPRPLLRDQKHQLAQACRQYAMMSFHAAHLPGPHEKLLTWAAAAAHPEVLSRQLVAVLLAHCYLSKTSCR